MEDDNQDGPFTVWQMFNAPTMVLFNNLEHAADGLDRLLTSILKLSGYIVICLHNYKLYLYNILSVC